MLAEYTTQRRVQQVRRRVVAADSGSSLRIHDRPHRLADPDRAFPHTTSMHDQFGSRSLRILHRNDSRFGNDFSRITDLATCFTVKGCSIENQLDLLPASASCRRSLKPRMPTMVAVVSRRS